LCVFLWLGLTMTPPFTDEDLKRLKEQLGEYVQLFPGALSVTEFDALLARLEAAEAIVYYCDRVPHTQQEDLKEAWRKAKGG
jgi:hypothetical protein